MRKTPCVISVAEHAGWAHIVCVAASGGVPAVVARRKVTVIDSGVPAMPYEHGTAGMQEEEADALIAKVRKSINARTALAMERLVEELAPAHAAASLAIREAPFEELPKSIAAVRASYRLQCAADGMLYQLAFRRAARQLGLDVFLYRRGEEAALAATPLKTTPKAIDAFVARTGRPSGPPWTLEHRRAYAAAIAALAPRTRLTIDS